MTRLELMFIFWNVVLSARPKIGTDGGEGVDENILKFVVSSSLSSGSVSLRDFHETI